MSFLSDIMVTFQRALPEFPAGFEMVLSGSDPGASPLFPEMSHLIGGVSGLLRQDGFCDDIAAKPDPFVMPSLESGQPVPSLGGALSKIDLFLPGTSGNAGVQLGSLNTAGISNQINGLMSQAIQSSQNGDALSAQVNMILAQIMFQTISQLMSTMGEMQKQVIQNTRLQ